MAAALANPSRRLRRLLVTEEAEATLSGVLKPPFSIAPERTDRARLDHLLGHDTVHQGVALLVISEELDELFTISDRLCVLAAGRLSPSVKPAETSIEQIGVWMSGKFGDKAGEPANAQMVAA